MLTGQYKLYGGVIRWAAGTDNAGQIVSHLLPATPDMASRALGTLFGSLPVTGAVMNSYQLSTIASSAGQLTTNVAALQATTQHVLQIATGTMVLSGLNLAVSAAGFAFINRKLNRLQSQLSELQKDVRAVRNLLELEQRTRLEAAINDLQNSLEATDAHNRRDLLFHARSVLGPISLTYRALLSEPNKTLEELMVCEEYFVLTSLAHARCTAELGMLDVALREIQELKTFWQARTRQIATEQLLGTNPERFLASDFVDAVPVTTLVSWCDFAYGDERGYGWVDELRRKTTPWYAKKLADMMPKRLPTNQINRETQRIIPSLQKLVARDSVLEGYEAQYELLTQYGVTPSRFNDELKALAENDAVDGYVILARTKTA